MCALSLLVIFLFIWFGYIARLSAFREGGSLLLTHACDYYLLFGDEGRRGGGQHPVIQIYEDIRFIGDPEQLRIHKKSLERESCVGRK